MRTVRKDRPGILHAHHVLVRLLRESVKFILPNCAELVDMGEIRQAHLDLARLPCPVVALESPWVFVGNEGEDKPGFHRSTKRIAWCITMGPANTPSRHPRRRPWCPPMKVTPGGGWVISAVQAC